MNKQPYIGTIVLAITACFASMLFEGCISVEPPAVWIELNNLNSIRRIKLGGVNSSLNYMENRQRAKDYATKGILKMNSTDTNELKLARQLFYASLTYYDESSMVWSYLGDIYVQESQLNSRAGNEKLINAIYYYSRAITLDSMNASFYYERADCYYTIGDSAYRADYTKSCSLGNTKACINIK